MSLCTKAKVEMVTFLALKTSIDARETSSWFKIDKLLNLAEIHDIDDKFALTPTYPFAEINSEQFNEQKKFASDNPLIINVDNLSHETRFALILLQFTFDKLESLKTLKCRIFAETHDNSLTLIHDKEQ